MTAFKDRYCVIMAGGVGARFWPKSRQAMPKQFLDIFGTGKSFIQMTFERFLPIVPVENFLVMTNSRYKALTLEQLPQLREDQVLCEPVGRNTAPCIAYAAYYLRSKNPDAVMVVSPSDHIVLKESVFTDVIGNAFTFVSENDALMTIGIKPSRPETGYGYIQVSDSEPVSKVKCFTEKPDQELAQAFLQSGEFFWNAGIFIWKVRDIVQALERYLPENASLFSTIESKFGTSEQTAAVEHAFFDSKSISIDYGVMEKAENVYVTCADFGWSDVGTWGSLYMHSRKDEHANATAADNCYLYDTRNSIISIPKGKVAVINGLKDYIVVDTEDALLICPKSEEQNIKKYIEDVRFEDGDKHL